MIFFNVAQARQQLLEKGEVFTLRPWRRREGEEWAVKGNYYNSERLLVVNIKFVMEIDCPAQLQLYLGKSGFADVESWWREAKGSKYLYSVKEVSI